MGEALHSIRVSGHVGCGSDLRARFTWVGSVIGVGPNGDGWLVHFAGAAGGFCGPGGPFRAGWPSPPSSPLSQAPSDIADATGAEWDLGTDWGSYERTPYRIALE